MSHFRHPNGIKIWVKPIKRGGVLIELIAENKDEISHEYQRVNDPTIILYDFTGRSDGKLSDASQAARPTLLDVRNSP
jgi:hypothetical protein